MRNNPSVFPVPPAETVPADSKLGIPEALRDPRLKKNRRAQERDRLRDALIEIRDGDHSKRARQIAAVALEGSQ